MRTKMKWLAAIGMIMILLLSVCALAEGEVTGTLSVSVSTEGTPPETPETYIVRLTADGEIPMPAGSVDKAGKKYYDLKIVGAGSANFPAISYDRVGIYTYTVRQLAGSRSDVSYDDSIFDVKVTVSNKASGDGFDIAVATRKRGNSEKSPISFVNIYPEEQISKTVRKIWDDQDNHDGIRPDVLIATLTSNDGMEPAVVTLNAKNKWTATVEKLPKFRKGTRDEIIYTWTEGTTDSAYTCTDTSIKGDTTIFTNSHIPTIDVSVEKIWTDADNQDGIRPGGDKTLRVTLLANGTEIRNVLLRETDGWKATITGLPKFENGTEISYTWDEKNPPVGYTLTGSGTRAVKGGQLTTLENTHTTATTSATIVKNWDDAENQDGIRPEWITATLSDGTTVTLNAENNWSATVDNLPKFSNGQAIVYTWEEDSMPAGYTLKGSSTVGTITTITNTHTPETREITIRKDWDDEENKYGLRTPVTLVLTASANQSVIATYTWVVEDDETREHTFTMLPVYNNGVELMYTVDEQSVPDGYIKTIDNTAMTVTNRHEVIPDTVDIQITKSWVDDGNRDGIRPANIFVQLLRNGEDAGTVTMTGTGDIWSYELTGLPKYTDGTENVYTIAEVNVPGYTSEIRDFAITNIHVPAITSRTVTKAWDDNNNVGGRPASVTVTLHANNIAVKTVKLDAANNWTATVSNLPVNDNGAPITYTWTEKTVAGYKLSSTVTTGTATGAVTILTNTQIHAQKNYRLRVFYRYTDGREASPTVEKILNEGEKYNIPSPVIEGYKVSITRVTGIMPNHDVDYLVLYAPIGTVFIDDFETPLGLGNVYINIGECFE